MAELPKILLLFANPKDDLTSIRKEREKIIETLFKAQSRGVCGGYHPIEDKPLDYIISLTSELPGYSASVFHFSGHANEQELLLTEDPSSVNAVCDLLNFIKAKLVFLNGCSTKGFLKRIFEETDVIAAIATYNKVRDPVAARLSEMFYNLFTWDYDLDSIFKRLRSSYEKTAFNLKGSHLRDLNLPDLKFPNEDKKAFQWGLFYKNPDYSKITITNLLSNGFSELNVIEQELDLANKCLIKANEELQELKKLEGSSLGRQMYNEKKIIADGLYKKITELKTALISLKNEQREKETIAWNKKVSEEFNLAIKNINYYKQRDIYTEPSDSQFACYAAAGDEDAVIDLLLMRMEEEFGFHGNSCKSIIIDYTGTGIDSFWSLLAETLNLPNNEKRDKIANALINDLYLGNRPTSQQHIFLKIYITGISLNNIADLICDFWTRIKQACEQLQVKPDVTNTEHKIVMMLIDEMSTPERLAEIEAIAANIKTKLDIPLQPMPWIKPLRPEEIENWINLNDLHRVGIKAKTANDIYSESNGKIRQVLKSVYKRCNKKDLKLFHLLNISDDESQSLLAQIGG